MNLMDLFSGAGGFSLGFQQNGFNIIVANEIDKEISETYKFNHPDVDVYNCDIKEFNELQVNKPVDIIIGGPPCQGFSMAGKRNHRENSFLEDDRNFLFREYFKSVKKYKPNFFILENVKGIQTLGNGEVLNEIINTFSSLTVNSKQMYKLNTIVLNAKDFGVPQSRERFFLIGSKFEYNFEEVFQDTIKKMKHDNYNFSNNIEEAIYDLNFLESGEGSLKMDYKFPAKSNFQKEMRKNSSSLYNHVATKHSDKALKRIMEVKPGENRKNLSDFNIIKSVHSGAYGRMRWIDKSMTIITRFDTPSSGRYIHPEKNRTITVREAARLQSFPDDYIFLGNKSSMIKQVGNAVPPKLGYFWSCFIKNIEVK